MLSMLLIMHSSSLGKPRTAFYLNELLTMLMNISFFFMEAFNSPNRSNDILSNGEHLKRDRHSCWPAHMKLKVSNCECVAYKHTFTE